MSSPQEAVQIVLAVEEKTWIPDDLSDWSFFSANDLWHYMGVTDDKLCDLCAINDGEDMAGDVLRGKFAWLEVVDKNTIYPHVHPNCRCVLVRIAAPLELLTDLGFGKE